MKSRITKRTPRPSRPLVLLVAVFLALSLAVHAPGLTELDLRLSRWLQGFRSEVLDGAAQSLTVLGNTLPLIAFGLAAALVFFRLGLPWAAALSAAIPPLTLSLNGLIKALVGRPRPDEGLVDVLFAPVGLSFPSGHALVPTVVYGFLALLAWRRLSGFRRLLTTLLLVALTVLIGLSRVYLGVHWFSDVVGGWTGGLLLLLLVTALYRAVAPGEWRAP
ncbi:MAG: phosphatase PAP2 family protein [Deinococcota bacterium]|nr:phosphatase PAP2 family protein [Deinococcota bacterium]